LSASPSTHPGKGIACQVLGDYASSAFGNLEMFEKQQKKIIQN